MFIYHLSGGNFHLSDTSFEASVFCLEKFDLFFPLKDASFEHLVIFELSLFTSFCFNSKFFKVMNQLFVLPFHLLLPLLVSISHNFELLQKLFIEVLNLIIFLTGYRLFGFELPVEESVGLFKLIDCFLKVDVFWLDVVILLLELAWFMASIGQALALSFQVADGF